MSVVFGPKIAPVVSVTAPAPERTSAMEEPAAEVSVIDISVVEVGAICASMRSTFTDRSPVVACTTSRDTP
ncbi:hypothetical protein D3C87_2083860 [compost metagenome]